MLTFFLLMMYFGGMHSMRNQHRNWLDTFIWPYHLTYWLVMDFLRDRNLI